MCIGFWTKENNTEHFRDTEICWILHIFVFKAKILIQKQEIDTTKV